MRRRWRWCIALQHPNTFRAGRATPAYIAHNGEINTVPATELDARAQARFEAEASRGHEKIRPIINPNGSDSGMFDNSLELLYLAGRSLPHAVMMMIRSRGRTTNP